MEIVTSSEVDIICGVILMRPDLAALSEENFSRAIDDLKFAKRAISYICGGASLVFP